METVITEFEGEDVVTIAIEKVVGEVVGEVAIDKVVVAFPITPIVVKAEGVPLYLISALYILEGLEDLLPENSNTLNSVVQLTLLYPEFMQ